MNWWLWTIIIGVILFFLFFPKSRRPIKRFFLQERKKSWQLKIINRIRKKHNLPLMKTYYALDRIANGHSRYMSFHHSCNHHGFEQRATKVRNLAGSGYVGENCFKYPARGYNKSVAMKLIRGWMKSPGHRANLLNPNFRKVGLGIATRKGYVYATQLFSS